jgi:hypothetical protein
MELINASRWLREGMVYDTIMEALATEKLRRHKTAFDSDDLQILFDLRKLAPATSTPVAFCNAFARLEEKEEGERRRPIFEPLINDILAESSDPILETTTRYTPKEDIRRFVYETACAAQFDFAAWFDQFSLAPKIRKFFGVATSTGDYELCVLPMGFRPSCQVAQATTSSIMSISFNTPSASCVDNVLFLGTKDSVFRASKEFLVRSAAVGAQIKDSTINLTTEYDFLGEHYDHVKRTRCLTSKTASKARYVYDLVGARTVFRTKQLQAIFGLLFYAANTLRITIAKFHWAMRFMSSVCATGQDVEHELPKDVCVEIREWARISFTNEPVEVYTPDSEADFVVYTDASAYGWGAISISRGGNVLSISRPWTQQEREQYNVYSSVVAEPLAIRKAIAALVPTSAKKVTLFTDHLPFCYAYKGTYGRAWSYSSAIQFLSTYNTVFDVQHVPGELNPADALSRARPVDTVCPTPPLLNVTSIAGMRCRRGGEVWEWDGRARDPAHNIPPKHTMTR